MDTRQQALKSQGRKGPSIPLPGSFRRRRPRSYIEWKFLKTWGKLPQWELEPPGFILRLAREKAELTQTALAEKLGCSQQAVAQAERWDSNPTLRFLRDWERATNGELRVEISASIP
ncbi:MAG: helix-turn-helix domain-containing protein [Nitrospirae bacterium]|nr:helix-turn-helix domain-containing protein [Nitrospirota bacterium]